jgi:glutamate carboxypeptidase
MFWIGQGMSKIHLLFPRAVFTAICFWLPVANAATDIALKTAAEKAQPQFIESLREMVMIESGSADLKGLAQMAALVESRLKALGFATERHKTTSGAGADIVVGKIQGQGQKKFMLQAHMDTVYQTGILSTQGYKVDGNRIYGPGIADDKGGIAVILHSLAILKERGWKDYAQLTVMFNPDEEVGSIGSGERISQLADQHDVVLSCEPTAAKAVAKNEAVLLGASGATRIDMHVTGKASHAGAAPDSGRNALIELSHQMVQTRDIYKSIPGVQLNWTVSQAGSVRNQIPDKAMASADVRTTLPGAAEKLQVILQNTVNTQKLIPETQTLITLLGGRPPYQGGAKARVLAEKAQAIYLELDRQLDIVPMTGGATDAAFAARSDKAAVIESFGLAGWGYHAKDEYIEVDSIVPRLYLMTRILTELGKQ